MTEHGAQADNQALLSSRWFSDSDIYEQELTTIFAESWLFVAHSSMLPRAGSYITNYMGEDPVIVVRDEERRTRVFLNKCRHRGNMVCQFDDGEVTRFRCSYHGWSYDLAGKLHSVPLAHRAYGSAFDMSTLGLKEAKVAEHNGLIFASWSPRIPLKEYLGDDLCWYLDTFVLDIDPSGLEVVPGRHRYIVPVNWKVIAENNGGDQYHFAITHASLTVPSKSARGRRIAPPARGGETYGVEFDEPTRPPHGILALRLGQQNYLSDLDQVKEFGPEGMAWLESRQRRLDEFLTRRAGLDDKPYSFSTANIFPNFSLIGLGRALYGKTFILLHPRGPNSTEIWQWCLVEKSAPMPIKRRMVFVVTQRQSAAGMVGTDDFHNFRQIGIALRGPQGRALPFYYGMGIESENEPVAAKLAQLPGRLRPEVAESYQRAFYRYCTYSLNQGTDLRAGKAPREA